MPPRKFTLRQPVIVDVGCGCRRPKLPSFLASSAPKPKPNNQPTVFSPSTTNTTATTTTATTTTTISSPPPSSPATKNGKSKWLVDDTVAVVKESSDPYFDFKESMVQMIVEMEIYAWDDLRDLLHRFLALNAPNHHHLIVRAFAEIWHGLLVPAPPNSAAQSPSAAARRRRQRRREDT